MGSYIDPERLRYHGYIYLGDVLAEEDEVRKLRSYVNLIGFVSTQHSLRCKYPVTGGSPAEREAAVAAFLREEGARIRTLDALDYTVGWPVPLNDLIEQQDLVGFRRELQLIETYLPEMQMVDFVYLFDEPNFRDVPTEMLEAFVDAFKEVFPWVKTWFCYAIVHPRFLEVVPPRNADWLCIDPYMITRPLTHNAADFEYFYRENLACALEWVNRWDKPFLIAGDCFASRDPNGKQAPDPDVTLWYYQLALLQPKCIGLIWFYYGHVPIESENLKGFNFAEASEELKAMHRSIGEAILKEPTPLGLPWDWDNFCSRDGTIVVETQ